MLVKICLNKTHIKFQINNICGAFCMQERSDKNEAFHQFFFPFFLEWEWSKHARIKWNWTGNIRFWFVL